jgi:hypothetical protein
VDSALLQKVEQPPKTIATKKSGANVSIRYDTAARLVYGETDESVDFKTFQKNMNN